MNLCADITIACNGQDLVLKPLTVRQRLAYGNNLVERERVRALENGRAAGLKPSELADHVAAAVRDAERMSAVVMSCWTLEGALSVIRLASDERTAEALGSAFEPGQLAVIAARCLNVDVNAAKEEAESGN
jgi:hypothetical protein